MTATRDEARAAQLERALRIKRALAQTQNVGIPTRPSTATPLLSDMQRSLWLTHQLDPSSAAYNLVSAYRLSAEVELPRLESAFRQVVARYRILRSTYRARQLEVVQIIGSDSGHVLEALVVEPGEVLAAARREARRPFDLSQAPLVRLIHLQERSEGDRLLLLVMHHILADELSLEVLWRQLAAAYAGQMPQSPPDVQFDDFVHWQANRDGVDRAAELAFWRQRLEPLPDALVFPFERPPSSKLEARGRLLARSLDRSLLRGTRDLAAAASLTPFLVFAFVFRLLLERYLPDQRLAFATPATTRSHAATADMIGYFLNPVVITASIDERQPAREALQDFGRKVVDLLGHVSVPFDVIAEALSPPRRPDRHPLFQVMFVHQRRHDAVRLGHARLEPVELDLGESKFDLTLFVSEGRESLDLAAEYRADRFDQVWIDGLMRHYQTLLGALVASPGRPTADLPMLPPDEVGQVAHWQGELATWDEAPLLPPAILERARERPEATAVCCGGVRWSYGELERFARSMVAAMRARGVESGARLGLFLERSPEMIAGVLASHWLAAAYVPLDPGYPAARNRQVLEDAQVAAVLTTSGLARDLPRGPWSTIALDKLEHKAGAADEIRAPSPDSVAYILYTSGSTGRPKGVVVSHHNLRASTAARREIYKTPPERFLLLPSVAFDSSVAGIFWTLAAGGTLVIPTREEIEDPRLLARLVAERRVDSLLCVPSLYATLLQAGHAQLTGLKLAIVAGETCPPALVKEHFTRLPGARLFNEYGPTEATVWATVHEMTQRDAEESVPIGRPIPGVQVQVLDHRGRMMPPGIPGEASVVGPTVAQGYWRRDDLQGERFGEVHVADGTHARMYRTGDLMAWTATGRLRFLGRVDDQIKLRGFRIEPGEIETLLLEHPAVEEVVVVDRTLGSEAGGPRQLVAFLRGDPTGEPAQWRELLAAQLPDFMRPHRYVQMDEIPHLPNGKADRERLRRLPLESEVAAGDREAPASDRERALLEIWRDLLARADFGVTENFFELGGHSLLVIEMVSAIEATFDTRLRAAEVFAHPTVRQLANSLDSASCTPGADYAHLFPIEPGGQGAPFVVAIPHVFTDMFAARFRGERPVFGLRGVGLRPEGNRGRWPTMRDLATELVEEIQRRLPDRPCILAGYSFGASMAFEAVSLMEERELPVHSLFLIAPMPLSFFQLGPLRLQLDHLRQPVETLDTAERWRLWTRQNHPLTRRPYARARRLLMVQPWRHLLCLAGKLRQRLGLSLTPRMLHADVRIERFRLHRGYRPGIIHTPTVMFNPREDEADIAATWKPHFAGPFTVVETPDPHLGEQAVEQARDVILEHLEGLRSP